MSSCDVAGNIYQTLPAAVTLRDLMPVWACEARGWAVGRRAVERLRGGGRYTSLDDEMEEEQLRDPAVCPEGATAGAGAGAASVTAAEEGDDIVAATTVKVGRCRLTISTVVLKAPMVSAMSA
jgi:hypothetical protein